MVILSCNAPVGTWRSPIFDPNLRNSFNPSLWKSLTHHAIRSRHTSAKIGRKLVPNPNFQTLSTVNAGQRLRRGPSILASRAGTLSSPTRQRWSCPLSAESPATLRIFLPSTRSRNAYQNQQLGHHHTAPLIHSRCKMCVPITSPKLAQLRLGGFGNSRASRRKRTALAERSVWVRWLRPFRLLGFQQHNPPEGHPRPRQTPSQSPPTKKTKSR